MTNKYEDLNWVPVQGIEPFEGIIDMDQKDNWRYDAPPKGEEREIVLSNGKTIKKWFSPQIIIVTPCETVTLSRWLQDAGRWNMMSLGEEPIAWQPWPEWKKEK